MSKEMFIALSGGLAYQRHLEVVSNNIANVSTVGFKADRPVFSVAEAPFETQGRIKPAPGSAEGLLARSYVSLPQTYIDMSAGPIESTDQPLDVALRTDGFFAVQGEGGDLLYTRAGNFRLDPDGLLVTEDGLAVMGEKGNIRIGSPNVHIDGRGQVLVDGAVVDRLRIDQVENPTQLQKVGHSLFSAAGATATPVTEPEVVQGALEQSNASAVRSMVELINVQRNFESFTKVVTSIDSLDQKLNQRIKA